MRRFHYVSDEEIKNGETTDIYFVRTKEVLEAKGLEKKHVIAEVTSGELPGKWPWGILCGIEEEASLFEGIPVDVYAMPEGSMFRPEDTLISFGIRRMHPALSPMIDRAAYIGGFDGVSSLSGAKLIGVKPAGTMPHALIIVFGDQVKAWKAFDEVISPEVPRVALVDTYSDEKMEAIMAAEALKNRLDAVRLDTPLSRRGNFAELIREVRWELNLCIHNRFRLGHSGNGW